VGSDKLDGGVGNDQLTGGADDDTFRFSLNGTDKDTITDSRKPNDILHFLDVVDKDSAGPSTLAIYSPRPRLLTVALAMM